jgi:hypothetical protein
VTARAKLMILSVVATVAMLAVLGIAFEPDVQTIDAAELVDREDDARAFFAADYVFIAIYAVLLPIAMWRYADTLTGRWRMWIKIGALLFVANGLVDAVENALLLSATDSVSEDTVDAAHALVVPKTAPFIAGAILALAACVKAVWGKRA